MSIRTYLIRCKKENLIWLFWIFINSLCVFLNGMLSARAITTLVNFNLREFIIYSTAILLVNILWVVQIYQGSKANEKAIQAMCNEIRKDISLKLEEAGIVNYEKKSKSTYLSWMTNDIMTISDLGFETLELMLMQSLNILFAIIAFLSFHFSLLFTITIFLITMIKLPKIFTSKLDKNALIFSEKNEELVQAVDDVLSGYRNLKNNNMISFMTSKIINFANRYSVAKINYAKTLGGLMAVQNGTSFISQITILIHAGCLYLLKLIPLGAVSSSQYFSSIIFAGLTGLTANYAEFKSVNKIFEKFENIDSEWCEVEVDNSLPIESGKLNGSIVLDNISLERSNSSIFSDLSLKFCANRKYAMIGKSGIGKSTLLKLINQELHPTKGNVYFVSNNLEKCSLSNLKESISYISSDDHIFNESLIFTLTLGKSVQKSDIDSVLERVYLKDWINTLPQGLDTILSETKLDISSGQKQRIMLARLFLEDKPIWLIDEGTSAIDEQIRKEIERDILEDRGKTVLFVTHHLNDELASLFDECIDLNDLV